MATSAQLFSFYDRILTTSQQMLLLAEAGEWDALIDLELSRRRIVGELRAVLEQGDNPFSESERLQSESCIRQILDLDNRTRTLAENWMSELDVRLQSVNTSRRLQNTYLAP